MKPHRSHSRILACLAAGILLLTGTGCGNIFVPKHKVLVDAITAPNTPKPTGQSYRLVAKKSVVNNVPVQVPVIKACIDAALAGIGMYEPPPNVPPDMFIEVGFGAESGPRVDPAARETFLQLSARSNPGRSLDRATGPELWDVRVGVMGIAGRMESAMPLLSAVAANYIATDTQMESKIEIPQNSPVIAAVRESAIRNLEGKAAPAGPPVPAGQGGTPPPASQTVPAETNGGSAAPAGAPGPTATSGRSPTPPRSS